MFKRQQCSVCGHSAQARIDAELAAGAAQRDIAERYSLSKSAVARHAALHFVHDDTTGQSDDGARQLEAAARRLLAASERKGDRRSTLDALKLLNEMRVRRCIAAASSPSASSPEQPHEQKRDVNWLCSQLMEIYGIRGNPEEREDERLIAMLKARVMREDCDGKISAVCTLAASLISGRPLDQESKTQVRRLLEVGDEVEIVGVVDDDVGEQIGAECDGSYDGDDEPAERSDSEPE
jgi:hypothetical protein